MKALKTFSAFNLYQLVLGLDKQPIKLPSSDQQKLIDATVKECFRRALNASYQDEVATTFEDKMKRFRLSEKIMGCGSEEGSEASVDLTLDELAMLKERVNKYFTQPEVIGFLYPLLEEREPMQAVLSENGASAGRTRARN